MEKSKPWMITTGQNKAEYAKLAGYRWLNGLFAKAASDGELLFDETFHLGAVEPLHKLPNSDPTMNAIETPLHVVATKALAVEQAYANFSAGTLDGEDYCVNDIQLYFASNNGTIALKKPKDDFERRMIIDTFFEAKKIKARVRYISAFARGKFGSSELQYQVLKVDLGELNDELNVAFLKELISSNDYSSGGIDGAELYEYFTTHRSDVHEWEKHYVETGRIVHNGVVILTGLRDIHGGKEIVTQEFLKNNGKSIGLLTRGLLSAAA